jgi:hypothetical protein
VAAVPAEGDACPRTHDPVDRKTRAALEGTHGRGGRGARDAVDRPGVEPALAERDLERGDR